MTVNVYWSLFEKEWLRAEEPVSIFQKTFSRHSITPKGIETPAQCPAVAEEMFNLYGLKSIYDYEFSVNGLDVTTNDYNQEFFNRHVIIRDLETKMFSFTHNYIFFTDADSLEATIQIPPYIDNLRMVNQCFSVPGKMDIGKWFRPIEFAFYLRDGVDSFSISEGEIYSYMQFHTKEKINFKKFMPTPALYDLSNACFNASKGRRFRRKKLEDTYKHFSIKNLVLAGINSSLVEG